MRIACALLAIAVVVSGLWIAYLGQYYYISTLRFPHGSVPLSKSAIVIGLIAACIVLPLFAGYRLVRYALHSK
jgi:hypothetical protein